LEVGALIAFLPAWLLRSMETSDLDDPIVLEELARIVVES
jgi:hypothetical protein